MLNILKQSNEHLEGNPNKTVLLQGEDGKTQVFVNNDEQFIRSHYINGKSFEDIGDGKNEIEFELPFRLHKDSTSLISSAGGSLAPALPCISYHNHVWWFWTYELSFKDDNGVIKVSFTLKSIGPTDHPTIDLPRGALGENIPRTQMAPNLQNPILHIGEQTFKLSTILGTPDRSYFIADFSTLEEFKAHFTEEIPFLSLNVTFAISTSYFDVESLSGINQPITDIVPKGVNETLGKIINGEKVNGADFVLTFGDSSKNDSVEFYVHRAALARTSSTLGQLFVTKMNPPGDQILVPTAEDRFIFPHLQPQDAKFFLTYFYTQQITLPHFGAFARVGRVFCMVAERPQVFHLFKQWQRLLVENLLNAKKNTKDSNLVIEESVKALIGIYSAPYGGLPVAKRVASSLLADKISQWDAESKNLVTSLRDDPNFKQYDLGKFLPGVVRLQHFISAVKKTGI
uniref:BTB domain-containing protein n=1 Tax=Panagrolaimus superbus TaxID=310955 RepID=A0A914XQE4_9BILA